MISGYVRCAAMLGAILFAAPSANAAVEISSKPTQNMSCTGGVCTPTAKKAVLNVSDLATMLAGGDTTIKSTNANPDIEIDAALSWTSTSRLTLDAYRSITFNKPIVVAGTGAMTITTNDGGSGGDFRFFKKGHVEFWDLTGNLVINGHRHILVKKVKQLAHLIRQNSFDYYALAKSIDDSRHVHGNSPIAEFGGTFEGLGNTISHFTISGPPSSDPAGLFGELIFDGGSSATIRDIGLISASIDGGVGQRKIGVLVGYNSSGTILNSYAMGTVLANGSNSQIGGLIGVNETGVVGNSYANVSVTSTGASSIAGGLIGEIDAACVECRGSLDQSYATGSVSGGDNSLVGGLVGNNAGASITNSYATGAVIGGNDAAVGGLLGEGQNRDSGVPIAAESYSTGAVTGGSGSMLGGFIGQDIADAENTETYWDLDTSGISDPTKGAGNIANDPGITGITDAQLKSALPAGFDRKVWKQKGSVNNGYPYLAGNPPPE